MSIHLDFRLPIEPFLYSRPLQISSDKQIPVTPPPCRSWRAYRVDDVHVLVQSLKLSNEPFGYDWPTDIPAFLIEFHLGVRFSYYYILFLLVKKNHLFFSVLDTATSKTYTVFSEVEISSLCLWAFIPLVHSCEIMYSDYHEFQKKCELCPDWVPHPVDIKSYRKLACQGYLKPICSYITPNRYRDMPRKAIPRESFRCGRTISDSEFQALLDTL